MLMHLDHKPRSEQQGHGGNSWDIGLGLATNMVVTHRQLTSVFTFGSAPSPAPRTRSISGGLIVPQILRIWESDIV